MSVAQFPDAMDSSADVQVWNNAAFDNGEVSEDLMGSKQSWGSLKSIFENPKASFDSVSGKENQGYAMENQVSSVSSSLKSSSTPFKPVNGEQFMEKSRIKSVLKKGFEETIKVESVKEVRDEKKIDEEIEQIESQILRLNSKLEALKIEKAERNVKVVEKRGRVVQAKFMDQKQSAKKADVSSMSGITKVNRRGISLGPVEIISGGRRGMSMGPSEIFGATKSRPSSKQQEMMITPLQSRRKSCFWKLQDIDEEKGVDKEKVKSCSVSPRSRKAVSKAHITTRQAVTTIASRKAAKKEDAVMNSVQPKKLFKDGEKSVPATNKKPLRPGRVVASRYNQNTSQASAMRKRSFPENDNDRVDKKRSLSVGKSQDDETESKNIGSESRVKKRWEIPNEIVVHDSSVGGEKSPEPIVLVPDLLPRLRIARCTRDSPRDSGPAKKVVELIGRKSFFTIDEDVEPSVCQALSYPDEQDEEDS